MLFNKLRRFWFLLLILILATVFLLILRAYNALLLADVWSNLAAGFITLIATILVIDTLLDKRKQDELRDASEVSKEELLILSNMLVSYTLLPMSDLKTFLRGIDIREPARTFAERSIKEFLRISLTTNFVKDSLKSMTVDDFKHLEMNLIAIKLSLKETISLYYHLFPPKTLGKLLMTRKTFNDFYLVFGVFAQSFIHNPITGREDLKEVLLKNMESSIINYLTKVKELISEINKA